MKVSLILLLPFFAVLLYAWERYEEFINEKNFNAWEAEEYARQKENWPYEYQDALFWDEWYGL